MQARDPLPDGFDRVGPVHPYLAWAGVVLIDIALLMLILAVLAMIGDSIDDALFPGGIDLIPRL